MPPKKRKGELPATQTVEAAQKTLRNSDQSGSMLDIDNGDDDESDLATMRTKYNDSQAELAAERLKNERLEAAASEPCARCHFYPDWSMRVRTMSGQVHTIACPDGPKTLVAHVKQKLAHFDPKCHILQQVMLVLPCEASSSSSSSSSADPTDLALADDQTLASCGLSKRDVVDLLLVDMNWSDECRAIVEFIKDGGEELNFATVVDDDKALAISWALVNAINPALSSLKFYPQSISASGVSKICAALCALSTAECPQVGFRISKLLFDDNNIGDAGANSCAELMRVSAWLRELDLYNCRISSAGAVSIGSALLACASHQLEHLNLNGNSIGEDGAMSIGTALSVNSSLKTLCMGATEIGTDGIKALAEALKVNGSLRKLIIHESNVDSAGVAYLADALQINSSLRYLNLHTNQIGDDGAVLLSAALRVNSGLGHLILFGNGIGDRGATSFGSALRANTGLKSLDLSQNKIGDAGVFALGITLIVNSSLTFIKLDNNEIGDGGAVALGEALCMNSALTTLTLHDNKIGALGAESIAKAQRENSRLKPIRLK